MEAREKKKDFSRCPKTGKRIKNKVKKDWVKWLFPITGLVALVWFLIRVIPKPTRATYPCQRVAFPIASSFVAYILGITGTALVLRKARVRLRQSRYIMAGVCVFVALICAWLTVNIDSDQATAAFVPTEGANNPVGTAIGINPGRVAWVHNRDATDWDPAWDERTDIFHWDANHTDQGEVDQMVSDALQSLTGETSDSDAWDALFEYFNENHGKGSVGYSSGEKIVIKPNHVDQTKHQDEDNDADASPQVLLALLKQLVDEAGISQQNITVCEASRCIADKIYDHCSDSFPNVIYAESGWYSCSGDGTGRVDANTSSVPIVYSGTDGGSIPDDYIPQPIVDANYVINLGIMKGHGSAGVTLTGKNWYGCLGAKPGSRGNDAHHNLVDSTYGNYKMITDLMGHEHLGGKTMLFMLDGLWGYARHNPGSYPQLWSSHPFYGDYPSSILVSQDHVAIDSVGFDFLRCEFGDDLAHSDGAIDDYLHEAAEANDPPSETFYDPEDDSSRLASLGTHEHWNNVTDKEYTRNLETGNGIELISMIDPNPVAIAGPDQRAHPNDVVVFDGSGSFDPGGEGLTYEWDFGDGSATEYGADANHVYSEPNVYTVTLTVSDSPLSDDDTCIITVRGSEIYVATDGNDLNLGSLNKPKATIVGALDEIIEGESIVLRGGTYTESVTIDSVNDITIKNYDGEIAIVDGNTVGPAFTVDAEEIVIEGLGLTNSKSAQPAILVNEPNFMANSCSIYGLTLNTNDGVTLQNTATGAIITGCNFGNKADGTSVPATDYIKRYGIRSYATDVIIEDCNFVNIPNNYAMYFYADANRTTIGDCEIRGTKHGIYFAKVYDCVVTNNLITGLTSTKGINLASGTSGQDFTITFNTISDNTTANAIQPASGASADSLGTLKYNIITGNAYGIRYDGLTNSYNLIYDNSSDNYAGNATAGTGDISSDPLFEGDYCLKLSSPAVDLADITAEAAEMDEMTTRVDTVGDFGDADAGYHRWTDYTGGIPPVAIFSADPEGGEAPLRVDFDGSSSYDPNTGESITAWDWDFGDGTSGTGSTIEHVFQDGNDYTVTLTVTSSTTATDETEKEISVYGTDPGGSNLVLIVSNAASPTANDQALKSWLEGEDYTVTLVDDGATQGDIESAAEANDVVVISQSIAGNVLQQKANAVTTGMVVMDYVTISDGSNGMGFAQDGATKTPDTFVIEDNIHYITGPFSGDVEVYSTSPSSTCGRYLASSAGNLATVKTLSDWSSIFVFEPNDALISGFGTAPARRVGGLLNGNVNNMTADGKTLLLRSIQWAAGGGGGSAENRPPVPVIDVLTSGEPNEVLTFDANDSYDPDPGDSIEDWLWDFGDGSTATGETVTHSYAETGTYTATLTVFDTEDANDSETETIYIQKASMDLLLIVSNSSNPVTNDDNLIAWLESRGHNITLADDSDSAAELADAADGNDAVIVSYSISGSALQQKANSIAVGMVVLDPVTIADGGSNGMGFAQDGSTKSKDTIVITDSNHYITSSYSGDVQIFDSGPIPTCGRYLAPDANGLATAEDLSDWNAILYVESGGDLISGFGTAAAKRAAGLLGGNINNMTEDGKTLLLRAIEWVSQ